MQLITLEIPYAMRYTDLVWYEYKMYSFRLDKVFWNRNTWKLVRKVFKVQDLMQFKTSSKEMRNLYILGYKIIKRYTEMHIYFIIFIYQLI